MSSILDTSSLYNTYSQTASNAVSSTLQSSLGNVSDTSSDDQLLEACKSFESYFVQKVIESAKATIADEDDEEVEDLILDTEAINDAVSTFDDVEALEIEN